MSVVHQTKEEGLSSEKSKLSTRELIILLVILFLGLFLRVYNLTEESLWLDEGIPIRVATLNVFQIWEWFKTNSHSPLYFIILYFWIDVGGTSEFSTRFLSLIFGFCSIIMIYKVGKLIFNKGVGFISALLLASSEFHIHYSQEVRMYSLMTLLTLFSFYFFIKLLKERNQIDLIGYTLSSSLLIYTHVFGLFIIMAQNIYIVTIFILSKKTYILNIQRWTLLQIILIVIYAPYIEILLANIIYTKAAALGFQNLPYPQ